MKWLFGNKNKKQTTDDNKEKMDQIFMQAMDNQRKEDCLVGAKIGAKDVLNRLINTMKEMDPKGVHIESLLCMIGSLAGYSCQASIRSKYIEGKGMDENAVFVFVEGADGKRYFFGDMLNKPLVESQHSVWALTAGIAQKLGVKELPDVNEIFSYVTKTVGSSQFGIPRILEGHTPGDTPYHYTKALWPVFKPIAQRYCADPEEWPIMFGLAIQEAITISKDVIDPLLALSIVMESAIPMSKVKY